MEVTGWITVKGEKKWQRWQGRVTGSRKNKPATGKNEIAIKLSLELPDALFERAQLEAKIVVPDDQAGTVDISADVEDNIASVLGEQLGMVVHVTSGPAED